MSKQDRQGVRTAAHLEQKYNFGQSFAELMGISTDIRNYVEAVGSALREEYNEFVTKIYRDTEKIVMEALANYVKTGDFESFQQTLESEFQVMADRISMNLTSTTEQITKVKTDLETVEGNVVEQAELTERYRQELSSDLSLLADRLSLSFDSVTETLTAVDGELKRVTEELEKHFEFTVDGLIIKAGGNTMELLLDNDRISFRKNGKEFGWWDGVDFHTGNIYVDADKAAQFGNYSFVPYSDGDTDGLDFVRVGG